MLSREPEETLAGRILLATNHHASQGPSQMAGLDLKGKSLVVIGGTTGLGLSAARAFVESGARVVVVGRNLDRVKAAQRELGDSARSFAGDALDPETAVRAVAMAVR